MSSVLFEMVSAKEKHGDRWIGSLSLEHNVLRTTSLIRASDAGNLGRAACNGKNPTRFDVLIEEVGEVADAIIAGEDPDKELTQVAAMCLGWLGLDDRKIAMLLSIGGHVILEQARTAQLQAAIAGRRKLVVPGGPQ